MKIDSHGDCIKVKIDFMFSEEKADPTPPLLLVAFSAFITISAHLHLLLFLPSKMQLLGAYHMLHVATGLGFFCTNFIMLFKHKSLFFTQNINN